MTDSSSAASPAQGGKGTAPFILGVLALVVVVLACAGAIWWTARLAGRVDDQQTVVVGQDQFVPGTSAGLRVVVREGTSGRTVPDASVEVSVQAPRLQAQVLYSGRTDTLGTVNLTFSVPADMPAGTELIVETRSKAGTDRLVRPIRSISLPARLLLTTDKPVYQPGQVIHMRALALAAWDLEPMRYAEVHWLVEDAKGNKVFRETATTSDYGIAAADFALASEVNQGAYKISATLGETQSEKTVTVKWYVLPKVRVELTTEQSFYLPGEVIQGHIQADYFFGKPVAGGQVQITGATYDVERRQYAEVRGTTDANGGFDFQLEVPGYLVGSAKESASYTLEVSVVDQADHTEQTTQELTVARQAILIDGVPESGQLRPGIDNIVYILTSYPDGSPAETTVQVSFAGRQQTLQAGEEGVAELRIRPSTGQKRIDVSARDASGRTGSKSLDLEASAEADQVLLRPDRPVYRVGESMHLEAFAAGRTRTIYLDVVKERQTLHMQAADIQDGKATFDVEVTQDLVGTLELNAYHVQSDGSLVRDTRIVVVNMPEDIDVSMSADKETYRPGEVANLVFTLSRQGSPVAGALGLSIVDESVFSVEEQDPGFARLVFLLEADLLEPRYQIKNSLQPILAGQRRGPAPHPQQLASAQSALAQPPEQDFAWLVNSFAQKAMEAVKRQATAYRQTGGWLLWALAGLPLLLVAVVSVTLRRRGVLDKISDHFWESMIKMFFLSLVLVPLGAVLLVMLYTALHIGAALLFVVAWLACLMLLALDALRRRDEPVQFVVLLLLTWVTICMLMVYVTTRGGRPDSGQVILMGLCGLAGLAGLYLLGLGLREQGAPDGAQAAHWVAALTVPTLALLVVAIPAFARSPLGSLVDPRTACGPLGWLTGCSPSATPTPSGRPAPTRAPAVQPTPAPPKPGESVAPASAVEAPRLRQYFPETLYWNPEAISDESGRLVLEVPLADSITTWRLSAQASTARGELGGLTTGLRVFQDFFVDLDLPVALTENDEVAVPVSVFNYLTASQRVRLELKQESWFDLLDASSKTLDIGPNEVTSVYFRIRAREFGLQRLTVTAWGERMSDAIAREIRVVPDGKQILKTASGWLRDGTTGVARIPQNAIPGTAKLTVKTYPGLLSQVVEGLDALLRLPFG